MKLNHTFNPSKVVGCTALYCDWWITSPWSSCLHCDVEATTASNSQATTIQSPSFSLNIVVQAAVTLKCCQAPSNSWCCSVKMTSRVARWMIMWYFFLFILFFPFLALSLSVSLVVDRFCNSSALTPQTAVTHISAWKVPAGFFFFPLCNTFTSSKTLWRHFFRILAIYIILAFVSECFEGKDSGCFEWKPDVFWWIEHRGGVVKWSACHWSF